MMTNAYPSYGTITVGGGSGGTITVGSRGDDDVHIGDAMSAIEFRYDREDDESGVGTTTSSTDMLRSTAETFPFLTDDEASLGNDEYDDIDEEEERYTSEALTLYKQKISFVLLNSFVVWIAVVILLYVIFAFHENISIDKSKPTTKTTKTGTNHVQSVSDDKPHTNNKNKIMSSTEGAECQLNPNCDNLGLIGNCCPTTSGIMLQCCAFH